jgi:hypothetical protein
VIRVEAELRAIIRHGTLDNGIRCRLLDRLCPIIVLLVNRDRDLTRISLTPSPAPLAGDQRPSDANFVR